MLLRYIIKPVAPLITPLKSDTLFGHFCWYMRYGEGETALKSFLCRYDGVMPGPVLFSSAFPAGFLPRPVLPPLKRAAAREFAASKFGNDKRGLFSGLSRIKAWNKQRWISISCWRRLKDEYDEITLYDQLYEEGEGTRQGEKAGTTFPELTTHNRISRLSGTVPPEGGGLFTREKYWHHPGDALDLYVQIRDFDPSMEAAIDDFLLRYLPETGFGADKSLGMGALEIAKDSKFNALEFDVPGADACMCLSLAAFSGIGSSPAAYRLFTRFGKLGGDFAFVSPTGGDVRPFKKPILMYEEGAVFFGNPSLAAMPLLDRVHSDERIRHCGIPITLPLKIREDLSHA